MGAMKLKHQPLPDDPQAWADLLSEQAHVIEKKSAVIAEQKQRIAILEEYLRLEKQKRFGASSEKNSDQGELFNELELAAGEPDDDDVEMDDTTVSAPKKTGRKPLSK